MPWELLIGLCVIALMAIIFLKPDHDSRKRGRRKW